MFQLIIFAIFIFLIILGLVEIMGIIALAFLGMKKRSGAMIIVPISGHDDEAEFLLRSAAMRVKWMPKICKRKVICLDCGMDAETRQICKIISKDYPFMEIHDIDELEKLFIK